MRTYEKGVIAMLVLGIRVGEPFYIGAAQVTLFGCDCSRPGCSIRVGVDAPRDIEVDRQKVRRDKMRNGRKRTR